MIDTTAIDLWLSAYLKAWSTDAPDDIEALFEPDARYRTAPFREPYVGYDAIVPWWVGQNDSAVQWSFEYEVVAREGQVYVVKGVTAYPEVPGSDEAAEVFDNIWLVTLTESGRAGEFVEYWMLRG